MGVLKTSGRMSSSYLIRKTNMYYAEMRIPKAVAHLFKKSKFSQTLKTDPLEEAEIRKLPCIAHWKSLIKAAKQRASYSGHFDFDQELETAKALVKEFGSGQLGLAEVTTQIKIDAAKSEEDKRKRLDVYASISKGGTVTRRFVDEWSQQAGYRAKSTKEANKFGKE